MRLAVFSASISLLLSALPAQEPPRWLVGHKFINARTGAVVGELGDAVSLPFDTNRWLGSEQYLRAESVIDLASERMIDARMGWLALRTLDGKAEWAIRALASFRDGSCPALTVDRVVFVSRNRGGLNGLDRANGKLLWRQADCPCDLVAIDGDLVIGADTSQPRGREIGVAAYALDDGRPAFEVDAPGPVRRVVASEAGIAVLCGKATVVYDRKGAELFRLAGKIDDMRAGQDGWFTVSEEQVEARDRAGNKVWSEKRAVDDLRQFALTMTADGKPLIWRYNRMADSGFGLVCRDPRDGSELWSHREPGLGVSQVAFHQVQIRCRLGSVFVLSAGGGGKFLVELGAGDGALAKRHVVEQ